jgi:hypothetical protein
VRFFEFNNTFNYCIDLKDVKNICKDSNTRLDNLKEKRIRVHNTDNSFTNIEYILGPPGNIEEGALSITDQECISEIEEACISDYKRLKKAWKAWKDYLEKE